MAISPWAAIRDSTMTPPPPDPGPWAPMPETPLPTEGMTVRPQVKEDPLAQNIEYHQAQAQNFRNKLANGWGTPDNHPGKLGKVAHVFSEIGNIAGNIVAPNVMENIPGTQLYNQEKQAENTSELDKEQQQLETEKTREQAAGLGQQKLAETTQHHNAQDTERARNHGLKLDDQGNLVPLEYNELTPAQQGVIDLKGSQERLAQAHNDLVEAQKNNLPEQMDNARKRIEAELRGQQIALQKLGVQQESLNLRKEQFYNPQPTGKERATGDLGESAVNQVRTIRAIKDAHPEIFGPGPGRAQRIESWFGSQSPDVAAFNSARTYLSEHSAGVFGGRGAYIIKALNDLTRPESNPEALGAALDVAERTAQHFVDKGKVHHGPQGTSPQGNAAPAPPKIGEVVDGWKFKGGDAHDHKNWEQVTH
jgi:hypothetical protein